MYCTSSYIYVRHSNFILKKSVKEKISFLIIPAVTIEDKCPASVKTGRKMVFFFLSGIQITRYDYLLKKRTKLERNVAIRLICARKISVFYNRSVSTVALRRLQ